MSKATMNMEFLAGTDIEEAVLEARGKARSIGLAYVCFNFNGVNLSIGKYASVPQAVQEYGQQISTNCEHKSVVIS